jgi:hypothetical protein
MWALCRDEWHMSLEEFGKLTMGMYEELTKRRTIRHRFECYYAGLTSSTIANYAGKSLKDGYTVSPLDFVPMPPPSYLVEIKDQLRVAVSLCMKTGRDLNVARERARTSLVQKGFEPGEIQEILDEVFEVVN